MDSEIINQTCEIIDIINSPDLTNLPRAKPLQPQQRKKESLQVRQIRMDCCHTCKIIFQKHIDFLKHKYKFHKSIGKAKSRYKQCPNCERSFIAKASLKNHKNFCHFRQNHRFQCSGCSKVYHNYNVLRQHERQCFVPELIGQPQVHYMFLCDHCGEQFNTKNLLSQHKSQTCFFKQ